MASRSPNRSSPGHRLPPGHIPSLERRHPFPAELGVAIRDTRLRRGLTQRETARLIGVGQAYMSRVERALRTPRPHVVEKLIAVIEPDADVAEWLRHEAAQTKPLRIGVWEPG